MPKCVAEPLKPHANVQECRSVRGHAACAALLKSQLAPVLASADVGVLDGRRGVLGAPVPSPGGQRGGKDRLKSSPDGGDLYYKNFLTVTRGQLHTWQILKRVALARRPEACGSPCSDCRDYTCATGA